MSDQLRELLRQYRNGDADEDEVIQRLIRQPFEEHMLGRFDHHREARTGLPEVVLAEGKSPDEVVDIFETYLDRGDHLMATRVTDDIAEALAPLESDLEVYDDARIVATDEPEIETDRHDVLVISAGASDRPVAREAAVSARLLGNPTETLADVGVAGLTRFAADIDSLDRAGVVIVVAGMDGALPSVVGGLAPQPLIAVPTSVGYGAAFEGVAPLLTMLNSCSPGTTVVNIDNGFGAAAHATKINKLAVEDN
ncbi:MAG: nickel pincer cofactor biosynthesis protein LarB [Bradymonadaceae bacterium]